ncbi:SURF1 family cytochrome oxidase biogenesis protein [Microbacterium halophytorum]|uniref:SURF1 family cytochrome oxidase biogenesis protein n=1 Tax=Microbacterium halophytorum TaxID=2067568 RepID=UPI000CFBBEA8|nr:SURF1 family protein [Microbacterium halophytorum]
MKNSSPAVRWTVYALVACLFAVACAFLSHWQFSRNAERAADLALIENNYDADPVPFSDLIGVGDGFSPSDEWRPVVITGEYDVEGQLLVRNRPHGGTSAYEVLVPLRMDDGRTVIVDRGWIPPGEEADAPDAVPAAPEGEVTVVARLRPTEPLPASGRGAPPGQLPTLHVPSAAEVAGPGALTDVYALMVSEEPEAAGTPHALENPEEDPGPFLSYAVQWILFAVMGFAFIGYMIRTEIRASREQDDDPDELDETDDAPRRGRRRKRARGERRRDADMEAEDALLDAPQHR